VARSSWPTSLRKANAQVECINRPVFAFACPEAFNELELELALYRSANADVVEVSRRHVVDRRALYQIVVAWIGFAEALVPIFFGFGCLTIAWLCVAVGLWRRP
jgi:hypothetical protein